MSAAPSLPLGAPFDARAALQQARTVERLNEASRFLDAPWRRALDDLARADRWTERWGGDVPIAVAARLFERYGAMPEELAQIVTRGRREFVLKFSHGKRAKKTPTTRTQEHEITSALVRRHDAVYDPEKAIGGGFATAVRLTHRAIHRALAGDDTTGGLIEGCPWCAEGVR